MNVARSVAEVLRDHVTLEVEGIDRMYLNAYVPGLQTEGGVAWFFREHRGKPFVSSVLMDPISKGFVSAVDSFVRRQGLAGDRTEPPGGKPGVAGAWPRAPPRWRLSRRPEVEESEQDLAQPWRMVSCGGARLLVSGPRGAFALRAIGLPTGYPWGRTPDAASAATPISTGLPDKADCSLVGADLRGGLLTNP